MTSSGSYVLVVKKVAIDRSRQDRFVSIRSCEGSKLDRVFGPS